jgi:hypothetical protein
MTKLNVGCGRNAIPGRVNLDSVDEFFLQYVLARIRNPLPLMQEFHRIARAVELARSR